jgi:hypothetical protein
MKFLHKNKVTLSLIVGFAILSSITAITHYTHALVSTNSSQYMNLGKPFLVEYYQDSVGKPEITDNNNSASFTGEGIINGTVNITAEGNDTETFRNNYTSYIQGTAKYVTDNKDIANYNFFAIGTYHPDGSFDSNGIAIFGDGATGELAFLSNSAGVYKDQVDKNGTGTFLMWHWK